MSENETKPPGVFITLQEIYATVLSIDIKLDNELKDLRKEVSALKQQLAAQWVVHGILLAAIIFLIQRGFQA